MILGMSRGAVWPAQYRLLPLILSLAAVAYSQEDDPYIDLASLQATQQQSQNPGSDYSGVNHNAGSDYSGFAPQNTGSDYAGRQGKADDSEGKKTENPSANAANSTAVPGKHDAKLEKILEMTKATTEQLKGMLEKMQNGSKDSPSAGEKSEGDGEKSEGVGEKSERDGKESEGDGEKSKGEEFHTADINMKPAKQQPEPGNDYAAEDNVIAATKKKKHHKKHKKKKGKKKP